jgi:hypothetical protein
MHVYKSHHAKKGKIAHDTDSNHTHTQSHTMAYLLSLHGDDQVLPKRIHENTMHYGSLTLASGGNLVLIKRAHVPT